MRKALFVACSMGLALLLIGSLEMAVRASGLPAIARSSAAASPRLFAAPPAAVAGQEIQATDRISIPFGFQTPLMLREGGQSIAVAGPGGCTAGQQVTVVVTLTQTSTAAVATGQWQGECTGELQTWGVRAESMAGATFETEPAQACGDAVTRDGETETDRFEWCREVDLVLGLYMPLVLSP